jgi:hypothetical protein
MVAVAELEYAACDALAAGACVMVARLEGSFFLLQRSAASASCRGIGLKSALFVL